MPHTDDDAQRKAIIAELREHIQRLLENLLSGEALTVLCTGVVLVDERMDFADKAASFSVPVDERATRVLYSVAHETVHVVQLVTCRFALEVASQYLDLVARTNRLRRAANASKPQFAEVVEEFGRIERHLEHHAAGGFSSMQVIEAHAVIEGFRGFATRHTPDALRETIRIAHGGEESPYTQAIRQLLDGFGFEFTLDFVPKLCWLALQTEDPGEAFTNWLSQLTGPNVDYGALSRFSPTRACELLRVDPQRVARSLRKRFPAVRGQPMHTMLADHFDVLEREDDTAAFLQLVMHPGRGDSATGRVSIADLCPPLTVYADDRVNMNGPRRAAGWDLAEPLIRASSLVLDALNWLAEQCGSAP